MLCHQQRNVRTDRASYTLHHRAHDPRGRRRVRAIWRCNRGDWGNRSDDNLAVFPASRHEAICAQPDGPLRVFVLVHIGAARRSPWFVRRLG